MTLIVGPILGGTVVVIFGYFAVFLFNAASYLISAFFESLMEIPLIESINEKLSTIKNRLIEG